MTKSAGGNVGGNIRPNPEKLTLGHKEWKGAAYPSMSATSKGNVVVKAAPNVQHQSSRPSVVTLNAKALME